MSGWFLFWTCFIMFVAIFGGSYGGYRYRRKKKRTRKSEQVKNHFDWIQCLTNK